MRYFVIKKGIQRLADNDILSCLQQTDVVQLQFNVDGLPLFKSSNMQLWPIIIIYFHGFFRNSDRPLSKVRGKKSVHNFGGQICSGAGLCIVLGDRSIDRFQSKL